MSAILVAYASKHGSTGEIADAIGEQLRSHGHEVEVRPAGAVLDVTRYEAVITGSAVYMGRWQHDAMTLLKRDEAALRTRPTWLFSSGPTGGSEDADAAVERVRQSATSYPAPKEVAQRMARIGARGHATFAGKAGDDMTGFLERWMPKGDWRDLDAVRAWADSIDVDLQRTQVTAA